MKDEEYISLAGDIFNGYSTFEYEGDKIILRHQSLRDQHEVYKLRERFYQSAIDRGIDTTEEILSELNDNGTWTTEKEEEISLLEVKIQNLVKTKDRMNMPSQQKEVQKSIDKLNTELSTLKQERNSLIYCSAEEVADRRVEEKIMQSVLFADANFTKPFYSEEDLEYTNLLTLKIHYHIAHQKFSDENIQKMVLQPFFTLFIRQCTDGPKFYGKPATDLTINQLKVLYFGQTFLNIFENVPDIPEHIRQDPEALLSFAKSKNDPKNAGINKDAAASMVFGSKEDTEKVAGAPKSLSQILKEKGGKLSMEDMIKMSGKD